MFVLARAIKPHNGVRTAVEMVIINHDARFVFDDALDFRAVVNRIAHSANRRSFGCNAHFLRNADVKARDEPKEVFRM